LQLAKASLLVKKSLLGELSQLASKIQEQ